MRKIKRAHITTIALCRRPANGLRTVLKSDGTLELATLSKAGEEEGELLAVVYAPDRPDSQDDFADAATIKAMAHEYNRDHRHLDIEHDGHLLRRDEAYLAESFIVSKGDERFLDWKDHDNKAVGDLTGAWGVVIKIEDPALRKDLKDGKLDGVSMFGKASFDPVDTKAASKRVAERIGKEHNNPPEESAMDEKLLKSMFDGLSATIEKALAPLTKKAEEETPAPVKKSALVAPVFKGDPTSDKDLASFEKELLAHELRKGMEEGTLTVEKVREMRAQLAETNPSDEEAGIKKSDSPEVVALKRQLFKATKKSNAPEGGGQPESEEEEKSKSIEKSAKGISDLLLERRGLQVSKN